MAFKKHRLYRRVADDLKRRSYVGVFFYMVILYLVLFTNDYYDQHPDFSNRLIFLIVGICLFRFFHWPIAKWLEPEFVKLNNCLFLLSVALTALIWGVGFAQFLLQRGDADANLLMVMCTIGLTCGASVAYVPYFRLAFIFNIFILVPGIFVMLLFSINLPLATAFILMFLYLSFMAYRGNQEYWKALENEYLLEEKSKDLEKISRIDGLTGLYNRRYFDEVYSFEWNRSVRKKQSISIILADIDYFKKVNDQYGHLAGDDYLKAAGQLLRQVFKREIDIIARYGGEEFIVLMPGETQENVFLLALKAQKAFEAYSLEYEGQMIKTTLSLGTATCVPDQDSESQALIARADNALYKSKENGRNRVTIG
ncbi:MAG: diguanylate cyclase [Proteobacteria bacterium]|nr:diguanylate cyclase [Pseudomonadota bacterium]MBU1388204.1 diguanylate cyclase [Pseudomonadota bacterium]MBU1543016.1 diguanylate cyclase [Pseudomonadota bacterium]MBU2431357.1 diguanylate cyclase [Pseudomonadota bacterium]MBU2480503.1 diguanylate cyclase [Pseudomonadota bacterium]